MVATDVDEFCLRMAKCAANAQNLSSIFHTEVFDVVTGGSEGCDKLLNGNKVDMYIMSDIFESSHVAIGAAQMTLRALEEGSIIWCFAQSDRANREVYLKEVKRLLLEENVSKDDVNLKWKSLDDSNHVMRNELDAPLDKLFLWDVNEEKVNYV